MHNYHKMTKIESDLKTKEKERESSRNYKNYKIQSMLDEDTKI